jgi:SAM-dependent methyltransferase
MSRMAPDPVDRSSPMTTTGRDYDRYATAYHRWWAPIIAPAGRGLLEAVAPVLEGPRAHLIDIGTGTGSVAVAALQRWSACRVTGVDPAPGVLAVAGKQARRLGARAEHRLKLLEGDAARVPLPDRSADAVVSSFVVQLVPNRAAATREAFRLLRPGGRYAVLTWQAGSFDSPLYVAFQRALDDEGLEASESREQRPYRSPAGAAAELRRTGLRRVHGQIVTLAHRFEADTYLAVLEGWIENDLFEALDDLRRDRLRRATAKRLAKLGPSDLVWRRRWSAWLETGQPTDSQVAVTSIRSPPQSSCCLRFASRCAWSASQDAEDFPWQAGAWGAGRRSGDDDGAMAGAAPRQGRLLLGARYHMLASPG